MDALAPSSGPPPRRKRPNKQVALVTYAIG